MFNRLRKLTRTCAAMFLTIFMVYYAIVAVYTHVHIVNGVMVVHSHPFSDEHNHTAQQTLVLHYASEFISLEAGSPFVLEDPLISESYFPYNIYSEAHTVSFMMQGMYLRAPPVSSFLFA